jgi:single-strand DNA-binding protein
MAANFNKVLLMGNLTRDIELRYTQSGTAIAKFGMAVNRRYTQQGGEQKEETCFVDLTAWGRQAEILNEYTKKGSPLFVEGRLEYSTWESQDGGKRSKLAVVVENFQLLGSGGAGRGGSGRGEGATGERSAGASASAEERVDYGDIPF